MEHEPRQDEEGGSGAGGAAGEEEAEGESGATDGAGRAATELDADDEEQDLADETVDRCAAEGRGDEQPEGGGATQDAEGRQRDVRGGGRVRRFRLRRQQDWRSSQLRAELAAAEGERDHPEISSETDWTDGDEADDDAGEPAPTDGPAAADDGLQQPTGQA